MNSKTINKQYKYYGMWPVAPTPFLDNGEVDYEGMERVLDCMVDQQVQGICILANYSEIFTDQYFGRDEFVWVLIISTVSQVGDIIISYFKRLSKIKDTGKLIPGHGGILDRIDGMLFAFPFYFIFYLIFY